MASSARQNSVRIRIDEILLWKDRKIQPFWLLVLFDSSPRISNVQDKIVSVLNSLLSSNNNNHNDEYDEAFVASCPHNSGTPTVSKSESSQRLKSRSRSRSRNDPSEYFYKEQHSHSRSSSNNFTMIDMTEHDDTSINGDTDNGHDNDGDGNNFEVTTCRLWMEGFLLLPNECSEILQNGDLITVKCDFKRYKTSTKETVAREDVSGNDPAEVSLSKKHRKKRKRDSSLSVTESFQDNCKELKFVEPVAVSRIKHRPETSSVEVNSSCFQDLSDIVPKKKSKHKKSKSKDVLEEDMSESTTNKDGSSGQNVSNVNHTCTKPQDCSVKERIDSQNSSLVLSMDKNNAEEKMSKSNHENSIYEQIENDNTFDVRDARSQNNSDKETTELSSESSNLLLLLDKKMVELKKNSKSPPQISLDQSEELEFQECNSPKRKRRRKRKKKTKDNINVEVQKKTTAPFAKQTFSPFKLPPGCQPENKRTTFETDSESDGSNMTSDKCNEIKTNSQTGNVSNSSSCLSLQVKGNPKLEMEPSSVNYRLETAPVIKNDMKTEKISSMKMKTLPLGKSPVSDFAHGQSINPGFKFDELLQRRKLSGNKCSVNTLQNGAIIFTREKQKGQKEKKQLYHSVTDMASSKENRSNPAVQQSQEITSATKGVNMDNHQDKTTEPQQASCLTTLDNLIEVTPVYLDIDRCKPLEGLPKAGDIIAYKILELSEDYTPTLSDFKQGQVVSCEDGIIQVELSEISAVKKRTGRFELVYEHEEEEDKVSCSENFVSVDFAAMVDTRLVQRCVNKGLQI